MKSILELTQEKKKKNEEQKVLATARENQAEIDKKKNKFDLEKNLKDLFIQFNNVNGLMFENTIVNEQFQIRNQSASLVVHCSNPVWLAPFVESEYCGGGYWTCTVDIRRKDAYVNIKEVHFPFSEDFTNWVIESMAEHI